MKMCQRIDSTFWLFILVAFLPHQLFAESCSDCRPEYGNCCSAENGDYVDPNDPLSGTKCFNQIPYDGLEVTTEGDALTISCDPGVNCISHCTWNIPSGGSCTIDQETSQGDIICDNIEFVGTVRDYRIGRVRREIVSCSIRVREAYSQHRGMWTCQAAVLDATGGLYVDNVNVTFSEGLDETILTLTTGQIIAISVPLGLLVIAVIVLCSIFCCCPAVWAACCPCCVRERYIVDRHPPERNQPSGNYGRQPHGYQDGLIAPTKRPRNLPRPQIPEHYDDLDEIPTSSHHSSTEGLPYAQVNRSYRNPPPVVEPAARRVRTQVMVSPPVNSENSEAAAEHRRKYSHATSIASFSSYQNPRTKKGSVV